MWVTFTGRGLLRGMAALIGAGTILGLAAWRVRAASPPPVQAGATVSIQVTGSDTVVNVSDAHGKLRATIHLGSATESITYTPAGEVASESNVRGFK